MNKELHVRTCSLNIGDEIQKKKYRTINDLKLAVIKKSSAFGGIAVEWTIRYPHDYNLIDPILLLKKSTKAMKNLILKHNLEQTRRLKFTISIHVVFEKASNPEIKTIPPVVLTTEPTTVYLATDIDDSLQDTADELLDLIEVYERNGSGWVIDHLDRMDMGLYSF